MPKALVVDDSRVIRLLLKEILDAAGMEVAEAEHGRAALATIEAGAEYDVLFVDWNMPEMNGLELIENVRARPELSKVPIIMVTTENDMSHIVSAISAGANEYIMKPFDKVSVLEKVRLIGVAVNDT